MKEALSSKMKLFFYSTSIKRACSFMLLLLMACSTTENITYGPTSVSVLVKSDLGQTLSGAVVRLFDDQNAYLACKQQGVESGYISKVLTDTSGHASFTNLDAQKEYYFFITYTDRVRLTDLDNSNQQYLLSQYLTQGTYSNVEITLQKASSIVSFYTTQEMAGQLPIQIYIESDSIGFVSQALTSVPSTTNQNGALSFRVGEGIKRWYAKSSKGCLWTDVITVSGAQSFTPILLSNCTAGAIAIFAGDSNKYNLPITITFNQNEQTTILSQYLNTAPNSCFAQGTATFVRDSGTYSYSAESLTGCVWRGSVHVTPGSCTQIKLPGCN